VQRRSIDRNGVVGDVRHGRSWRLAMRAIAAGADSTSELGRRLGVSKQAAAKAVAVLQDRGYVERDTDPIDARRKRLQVTELGLDVLQQGEAIFNELREQWQQKSAAAHWKALSSTWQCWSVRIQPVPIHPVG
jgi:DNA-binding MarR family transcriptional regulator